MSEPVDRDNVANAPSSHLYDMGKELIFTTALLEGGVLGEESILKQSAPPQSRP